MNEHGVATRRERRVQDRARARRSNHTSERHPGGPSQRLRALAFGGVAIAVLAIGAVLAFGDFLDRPGGATAGVIDVQSSMAGFDPSEIRVRAGETVTLNWWTDDAAVHLQGGVHTMVSPDLGLDEELPAEGARSIAWTVPDKPGTYDVWCETCCGGKDSPTMHGRIVVEPRAASAPRTVA